MSLTGKALSVTEKYSMTSENHNTVWDLLGNRFENINLLVYFKHSRVGKVQSEVKTETNVRILSKYSNFFLDLTCLVLPQITDKIPSISFPSAILEIPDDLRLADPDFNQVAPIDILIGAAHFYNLQCIGQFPISHVPSAADYSILQLGEHESTKALGVMWNSSSDTIQFKLNPTLENNQCHKMYILSITSQIFDPLGLLGPDVLIAKLITREL
ncbi:hypothetical protein ILUMI_08499 [Ignelater luminosus]|uniref:Uncharacterized protein n=1 Tax=Ignelater luminosus TaxID=2038154 RepID=A0A8K0D7I0_IGNLU|nr:hypothetical protein ILUMI_08499 [Ignelater luminosus]